MTDIVARLEPRLISLRRDAIAQRIHFQRRESSSPYQMERVRKETGGERSLKTHPAMKSPGMMDRTLVLGHHLRELGLSRFQRTGESNNERRAPVRLAIHAQRAVMPFDDRLRDAKS
jgi:hypothetical protein